MEEIITASGKRFQTDYIAEIPEQNTVFIRILGSNIAQIAYVFGDPEETGILTCGHRVLKGYRFFAMVAEDGAIKVNLTR